MKDNNAGPSPAVQGRLFQKFHLLHQSENSHALGLSVVQRLMELQDGKCGFEPVAGGGSCFYFTLPTGMDDVATVKSGSTSKRIVPKVK